MATTTSGDSDRRTPSLRLDSIATIDLRLLSQSELYSLSTCSNSSSDLNRCDDVVIPKIDRSVFNESAGSRKQTYSRLRLAAPSDASTSSKTVIRRRTTPHLRSPHAPIFSNVDDSEDAENTQIVCKLKELFKSDSNFEGFVSNEVRNDSNVVVSNLLNPEMNKDENKVVVEVQNDSNAVTPELMNSEMKMGENKVVTEFQNDSNVVVSELLNPEIEKDENKVAIEVQKDSNAVVVPELVNLEMKMGENSVLISNQKDSNVSVPELVNTEMKMDENSVLISNQKDNNVSVPELVNPDLKMDENSVLVEVQNDRNVSLPELVNLEMKMNENSVLVEVQNDRNVSVPELVNPEMTMDENSVLVEVQKNNNVSFPELLNPETKHERETPRNDENPVLVEAQNVINVVMQPEPLNPQLKRKRGRPRKDPNAVPIKKLQKDKIQNDNNLIVPELLNHETKLERDENAILIEVQNDSNVAMQPESMNPEMKMTKMKRKRGRPRKDENPSLIHPPAAKRTCNNTVKKEVIFDNNKDRETLNDRGVKVNIENLGRLHDPYGPEIRRRTEGMSTADQLLAFLSGLKGQWGTTRKKRRVVDASDFGDFLPKGWRLNLSIKKKAGCVWLSCRRYISPSGRQFESCKEASMYLLSILGEENFDKPNLIEDTGYDDISTREAFENAVELFIQEDLQRNGPVLTQSAPSTSFDQEELKRNGPVLTQSAPPTSFDQEELKRNGPVLTQSAPSTSFDQEELKRNCPVLTQAAPSTSFDQEELKRNGPVLTQSAPSTSFSQEELKRNGLVLTQSAPPTSFNQEELKRNGPLLTQSAPSTSFNQEELKRNGPVLTQSAPSTSFDQEELKRNGLVLTQSAPPTSFDQEELKRNGPLLTQSAPSTSFDQEELKRNGPVLTQSAPPTSFDQEELKRNSPVLFQSVPLTSEASNGTEKDLDDSIPKSDICLLESSGVTVDCVVDDSVCVKVLNHSVPETRVQIPNINNMGICNSFDELPSEKERVVNSEVSSSGRFFHGVWLNEKSVAEPKKVSDSDTLSFVSPISDTFSTVNNTNRILSKKQDSPQEVGFTRSIDEKRFSYVDNYNVSNMGFDTQKKNLEFSSLVPSGNEQEQEFRFQDDVSDLYESSERGFLNNFCDAETSDDLFGFKFGEERNNNDNNNNIGIHDLNLAFGNPHLYAADINQKKDDLNSSFSRVQTNLSMVNNNNPPMVNNNDVRNGSFSLSCNNEIRDFQLNGNNNNNNTAYSGRKWEDFRSDEFRRSEHNKLMMGSGSNHQQLNEMWRPGLGNQVQSGLRNQAQSGLGNHVQSGLRNQVQSGLGNQVQSGLGNQHHTHIQLQTGFHSFDIMSNKAEDRQFRVDERYNNCLNGVSRSEPTEFSFFRDTRSEQHNPHVDSRIFPGMEQGFWMGQNSNFVTGLCSWCRNEFPMPIHNPQTQIGNIGSLCPTCSRL